MHDVIFVKDDIVRHARSKGYVFTRSVQQFQNYESVSVGCRSRAPLIQTYFAARAFFLHA